MIGNRARKGQHFFFSSSHEVGSEEGPSTQGIVLEVQHFSKPVGVSLGSVKAECNQSLSETVGVGGDGD